MTGSTLVMKSNKVGLRPHEALVQAVILEALRDHGVSWLLDPCAGPWMDLAGCDPSTLWYQLRRVAKREGLTLPGWQPHDSCRCAGQVNGKARQTSPAREHVPSSS